MTLLDVGPLLALVWQRHEAHERAMAWLDAVNERSGVCRVTAMGLLRLLSNPAVMSTDVVSRRNAWRVLDTVLSDDRFEWCDEPGGVTDEFRRLSATDDRSHKLWTDDYLAAFALATSSSLTTLDRKLPVRYPDLDVIVI
ncbi:MAG: hypothetical protein QM650_12145 [Microlunatus sp.]